MSEQLSIFEDTLQRARRGESEAIERLPRVIDEALERARSTGRQLAEAGMARTLKAEREEWILRALNALRHFCALPGWQEFKTEDFRWWRAGIGAEPPHSHKCWGALTNRATKEGIIRFTGKYQPSVSPKTHGHPVKVWTRA